MRALPFNTLAAAAAFTVVASAGQAPALKITSPLRETLVSGATRLEVAISPPEVVRTVQTVTFTVDGRLACTVERPPFVCTWDPGEIVRGHHVRVVARLADGGQLSDNVHTKDLGFTERMRTEAVLVPVVVSRDGEFVRGLKQQDFEIVEDGVKQSIASVASEDAPLDLVLAIDVSGSMEHALDHVKSAVKLLLSKLRPGDAATLVGFNDTMFLAAEREKDQQARERAVDLLSAWGGTALYDATVRALDLVSREWGRKGIVIFSDGDDRNSLTTREAAAARVAASDSMLYSIGFGGGATIPNMRAKLEGYAKATGGRAFFPQRAQELDSVFDQIVSELANQYVLSYSSTNVKLDNTWRKITGTRAPRRQVRDQSQRWVPRTRTSASGELIMTTGSTRIFVVAATAATLLAAGGPSISAQQTAADQPPAFRSGVEVVTVDVGVVDRQGQPLLGLTPADFVVTVAGQPRQVVTAEFVDRSTAGAPAPARPDGALISTNEGGGTGRLFAFIVDQNTLDLGSARRVAMATTPFFSRLTFADRSALMLMPLGPNVSFTWSHDRVRTGLQRVSGLNRGLSAGWEYGSLSEARDIANRNLIALRGIGERECGSASASGFGAGSSGPPSGSGGPASSPQASTGPGRRRPSRRRRRWTTGRIRSSRRGTGRWRRWRRWGWRWRRGRGRGGGRFARVVRHERVFP